MRSPHTAMKSSPCSPQLERACVQQWRPKAAKNKQINKYIFFKKRRRHLVCLLVSGMHLQVHLASLASSICQTQGPDGESNPSWSLYPQNWRLAMQTAMNQMLPWRPQFMGDMCFYHEGNEVSRGQNLPHHSVGWPLVPVRKGKSWLCPLLCLPIWLSICLKFDSF